MSRIPSKDIFKDDHSARSYVDPILNSPYSTVYEKPLRIMKIDSNGEETFEVTKATYRTINDAVSYEKLTEICETLITERMLGKEKSLMSQLGFSLGEQVIEIEKRLTDHIDFHIDQRVKEKHFDPLEREMFQRLDHLLTDRLKFVLGRIMDDFDEKLEMFSKQIKEELQKEMGGAQSNLKKIVENEVQRAMDDMRESDMEEDEGCQDVLCDLPQLETINKTQINELMVNVLETLPTESELLKDLSENNIEKKNFEFVDENLLDNGEDMVFDNRKSEEKVEDVGAQEETEQEQLEKLEESVVPQTKEEEVPSETKEEVPSETKEEVASETKEEVASETKEEVASETKEEVASETKEEVASETKEEVIQEPQEQVVQETKEEVVQETKEEVIQEPKEEVIQEPKEEVIQEPKEEVVQENVPVFEIPSEQESTNQVQEQQQVKRIPPKLKKSPKSKQQNKKKK
jgi:hypothetical protein